MFGVNLIHLPVSNTHRAQLWQVDTNLFWPFQASCDTQRLVEEGQPGQERRTMQSIMLELVAKNISQVDDSLRTFMKAKLLAATVDGNSGEPPDFTPEVKNEEKCLEIFCTKSASTSFQNPLMELINIYSHLLVAMRIYLP